MSATWSIYSLWASMDGDGWWMIAAEDEACWEGDPTRCERVFADARARAEKDGCTVREATLSVPFEALDKMFAVPEIRADVS